MDTYHRFFAFGRKYFPGDDYVRCDHQGESVVVAPGVGEQKATEELSLPHCISFVRQGIMCETNRETVSAPRRSPGASCKVRQCQMWEPA